MTLPLPLADLRARARRVLPRVIEGGPFLVVREGVLLACRLDDRQEVVTEEYLRPFAVPPSPPVTAGEVIDHGGAALPGEQR